MDASHTNKMMMFGLLGFAIGMLFAPEKGDVTRDKIKKQAESIADKAKEQKDAAKRKLNELRGRKDDFMDDVDQSVDRASADLMP
ncbi:YtxH domain-containing protein [Candidatus Saccharibacteria bacterium]|nr:YtxH domain-containing protein [Candidatus Saccharibacteria bacterium]